MTKSKIHNKKIFNEIKNLIDHCDVRLAKITILAGSIKPVIFKQGDYEVTQKPHELCALVQCIIDAQMKLDHALIIMKRIEKESK